MCLIMTILAAVVFSVIFLLKKKNGIESKNLFTTTLMFWAASLMWSMDSIASVMEGEGFFDISMEDTVLGFIILASGIAVFAVLSLLQRRKA